MQDDFRENYANLWASIIRSDVNGIQASAEALGVGKLYDRFACLVTGRTWNAILGGIDKHKKTTTETKEVLEDAEKYIVRKLIKTIGKNVITKSISNI